MENVKDTNIYEVVIFHHNDADGYGSAAVLKWFHADAHFDNIKCVSCKHGTPIDPDIVNNINEDTMIYIVDYSFSNKQDQELLKRIGDIVNGDVFWIDHHATSEELLKDDTFKDWALNGLVRTDNAWAGIGLTYYYCKKVFTDDSLFNITTRDKIQAMEDIEEVMEEAPHWIRYIDDYDKWAHKLNPFTDNFIAGLSMYSFHDIFIDRDLTKVKCSFSMNSHFENDKKSLTLEILKEGEIISAYQKKRNELAMRNSFESFIDYKGSIYKVLCCNASGNSKLFGDLINEYDAVIPFTYDGTNWNYSMFSKEDSIIPSCGEICSDIGRLSGTTGGGHVHAAGFVTKDLLLFKGTALVITDEGIGRMYNLDEGTGSVSSIVNTVG